MLVVFGTIKKRNKRLTNKNINIRTFAFAVHSPSEYLNTQLEIHTGLDYTEHKRRIFNVLFEFRRCNYFVACIVARSASVLDSLFTLRAAVVYARGRFVPIRAARLELAGSSACCSVVLLSTSKYDYSLC